MHKAEPAVEEARRGQFGFTVNNTCGAHPNRTVGWTTGSSFTASRRRPIASDWREKPNSPNWETASWNACAEWFEPFDPETNPIRPSILHGDLWSGNIGTVDGAPTVFDPARVLRTQRGRSLACRGARSFTAAVSTTRISHVVPKTEAFFEEKTTLPPLSLSNHYNLFGGGYKSQCVSIMNRLLR